MPKRSWGQACVSKKKSPEPHCLVLSTQSTSEPQPPGSIRMAYLRPKLIRLGTAMAIRRPKIQYMSAVSAVCGITFSLPVCFQNPN